MPKRNARPKSRPKSKRVKIRFESILVGLFTLVGTVIVAVIWSLSSMAKLTSSQAVAETPVIKPFPTPYPQASGVEPEPYLTATAAYLYAPETNTVLLSKNPHLKLPPASITKIMTALVALKNYPLDQWVTVKDADRSIGQTANLLPGEVMTVNNLLKAMLINSGNDAAVALAQHYPQGYAAFVDQMNQEANHLGLTQTRFANVSGVPAPEHYSTVYDLAHLGYSSQKNPTIQAIVATQTDSVSDVTSTTIHPLTSTNLLLADPTVTGIKTGWTAAAGECLLVYANRDGYPVILAILGSQDRFGESRLLLDWVYRNFKLE